MKLKFDVTPKEYLIIKDILIDNLPSNVKVWIFGSRAKNQSYQGSDLDLAIEGGDKIDDNIIYKIKNELSESLLPYKVDLLDMNNIEPHFKEIIDKQKKPFPIEVVKKTPILRFKEFTDDWVEKRFGEVGNFIGGGTPYTENNDYWDGGIEWFTPSELGSQKYVKYSKKNISNLGLNNSSAKYIPMNSLIISTRATIAQISINKLVCSTNQGCQSLSVNKYNNNEWIYYWVLINKNIFFIKASGSTFLEISKTELKQIKIHLPSLPEQEKIAGFLCAVDERIEKLEKKLKLLEQYKKGIMQKLFSQNLRFPPFTDAWVEKRLGDVCDVKKGQQFNKDLLSIANTYPCINGGQEPSGYTDKYNTKENTITISEGGESCGFVRFNKTKFYCTNVCGVLMHKNGYCNLATALLINSVTYKYVSYIGNPKLMNNTMSKIKIHLPSLPEQEKIANFLTSIDNKIENIQSMIEQNKQFKKGLLQKMFV